MTQHPSWPVRQWLRFKAYVRRNAPFFVLLVFLLGFGIIFFFDKIVITVNSGELAVLWRRLGNGTEIHTTYGEGVHFVMPIDKMVVYSIRKQQYNDTIDVLTADGLTVKVRYTARYFLTPDMLPRLHQSVGPDYLAVVVKPEVRTAIRTIFGQYKPEEIYTTQRAIQERVSMLAKTQLQARFVALDDVPIEGITLPPKISEAIEAKMALQQQEAEYEFRLSIAKKEIERKQLEADGVKHYNGQIAASLTPDLLSWYGIQATDALAKSPNSKTIVIGAGKNGLPIIFGKD